MNIWGWIENGYVAPPISQITHFTNQGVNVIRLPFGWQRIEPNGAGTGISSSFLAEYDNYVQTALKAGAYVILDLHK